MLETAGIYSKQSLSFLVLYSSYIFTKDHAKAKKKGQEKGQSFKHVKALTIFKIFKCRLIGTSSIFFL